MAKSPNRVSRFLQEIKRRNVHRLMAVYGGTAFIIFEASTMIFPRWGLPDWTIDLVLYLLILGAIITFVIGWIYDIHPEGGVVKTKPAEKAEQKDLPKPSNVWKVASYISFVVILGLIGLNIFNGKRVARIDDSLSKSIAVLPFQNLSGNPSHEYICEGLTNDIINNLYKLRSFEKVSPFVSILGYKALDRNIQMIAKELEVEYILSGSYMRMGDEFKLTAQLIEAQSDNHIWLGEYELPYGEVTGIPGEFTVKIAKQVNLLLTDEQLKYFEETGTSSLRAYEIVKQVKYHFARWNTSYAYEDSLQLAIELDPEYAEAYTGLGFVAMMGESFIPLYTKEGTTIWQAQSHLEKAIELDPDNFLANLNLGLFNLWIKWDYIAAEKYFEKALELTREDPWTNQNYGEFLLKMNRLEDALTFCNSVIGCGVQLKVCLLLGMEEEVNRIHEEWIQARDTIVSPLIGEYYIELQQYDSAVHYFELSSEQGHFMVDLPRFKAGRALAYHETGNFEAAKSLIAELRRMVDESAFGSPDYFLGKFYSCTAEVDSAFFFLEKAVRNNCAEMPWLKVDPAYNNLKVDDRYWDLYERTGHKAYDDYLASKNGN